MKNLILSTLTILLTLAIQNVKGQTVNWGNSNTEKRNYINVHGGTEFGAVFGAAYGYQIKCDLFPIIADVEFSFPSGENVFDDFKTKTGVQIRWAEYHHFQFSTRVQGVFRRYENDYARLLNFGSDMSGILGYYRSKWFVAGEVGFDKAIITHYKHSEAYRDQYPEVSDGWYGPATGGNFYYGVQTGVSFGKHDVYVRAGKLLTQDFKTAPLFPFYGELGYTVRL